MNESDEALVLKSQKKDRAAFAELVRRTSRLVFSRIYLAVRDAHRAEDLTQEVYMTAWKSIAQVSDAAGFRLWLMSIIQTTLRDAHRHDSRKKRAQPGSPADPDSLDLALDLYSNPAQFAERQEQRERVLKALQMLPVEYREPLSLRYLTGADYETISQQLGLSNGSLRGLLNRGMAMMRESLAEEPEPKISNPKYPKFQITNKTE